ncbi:hypothetical protein GQ44DRAFT_756514 [Phaeosphaeriaceae sp. PMI808]|nr:hypothetical protein GQ44DRAFT_756514 [Phaeosphaeriaceae sp. PMI808]
MLIPKADRKKIHEYLFREGVLVAKKDFNLPKHGDIDTKNLFVVKALLLLHPHPEGLDYLREWLHLPAEIVPQTHIKQQRSAPPEECSAAVMTVRGAEEAVVDVAVTEVVTVTVIDDVIRVRRVRAVPPASSSLSSVVALGVDAVLLLLPKRLPIV